MSAPESPLRVLPSFPAIPYGLAYFKGIRREGCLYVDKTRFLHALEQERFVFFIRPRRFGKTCWLSLLESYYARTEAGDFEAVFSGTDIGRAPTPNRSRYVVLRFNFSAFNDALETLERNFENYCHIQLIYTLEACPELFPERVVHRICSQETINDKLNALFRHSQLAQIPLYIISLPTAAASIAASSPRSRPGPRTAALSGCSSPASRRSLWTTSPAASTSAPT